MIEKAEKFNRKQKNIINKNNKFKIIEIL